MTRKELKLLISAHNATRAAFQAIAADLREVRKELDRTGQEAEKMLARAKGALGGLMGVLQGGGGFSLVGTLGGILGGIGIGAGVAAFTKMGIEANTFRENTLSSLEAITKSKKASSDLFEYLSHFADVTPFDDQEVVSAGKALMTFGLDARKYLGLVGDAAFSMKVPLEQVVGVLAKLKAGQFDISEMAPVGVSREGLQQFGIRFNKSGEPTDRRKLFDAGVKLLQSKFGGGMENAAAGFDATFSTMISNVRRVAREGTTILFGSLKTGFTAISDELEKILANRRLIDTLRVLFDGVGHAIELAAKQIPVFVGWLERVAKADGVRLLLTNITAFALTVGEELGKLLGFDLGKVFDPNNIQGFFNALGQGVVDGVNAVFGLGRVWSELQKILGSFWVDTKNELHDWADDALRTFKMMFAGLQVTVAQTSMAILGFIKQMVEGINKLGELEWMDGTKMRLFKPIDTSGLEDARKAALEATVKGTSDLGYLAKEGLDTETARRAREARRDKADPFRHDSFGKRINDAFFGINRDTSAQDEFWARFERNRKKVEQALFPKPDRGPDVPPPPDMFGQGVHHAPTVNGQPVGAGAGFDPKAFEAAQDAVEILKANAGLWDTIVDASKAYAETLGDHGRATRGVMTAMLGQLGALNQLQDGQRNLLRQQDPWTKEWLAGLQAINSTSKEITGLRKAMRDLLFDTEKLNAASDTASALFDLAKDAGFDQEQLQLMAAQQQALLLQSLDVERARLGTLEAGTLEWHKQQKTVVDTIAKILKLRGELDKTNGAIDKQQLGFAKTPFGIRGAGVEPGPLRKEAGENAKFVAELLRYGLNPGKIDLDAEARRVFGGGMPKGGIAKPDQAAATATAAANVTVNSAPITIIATQYQAIRSQVLADVDAKLAMAFNTLKIQGQMRSPGR